MNWLHDIIDILRNSVLITGLVIVMMMMIEALNIESRGRFFSKIRKSGPGQIIFSTLLGLIPGCMGGFAAVSLYTHGMLSFGALVAMMIASSGDEAFVMLAMFPREALILSAVLAVIAVATGLLTDLARSRKGNAGKGDTEQSLCGDGFEIHEHEDTDEPHGHGKRHFGWKRAVIAAGLAAFIAALGSGFLEHDHADGSGAEAGITEECGHSRHACGDYDCGHDHGTGNGAAKPGEDGHSLKINLLDESWMNILFACLSVIMLGVIVFAPDHFIDEHLWHHVIKKHFLSIFLWTAGVLAAITLLSHFIDISTWVNDNTALMILLAVAVGIIPESGPHLIFVTLFAAGLVPFPVLLASSISQDGHASLPLLAESKQAFLKAKAINCAVALLCGFTAMMFIQ